MEKFCRCKSISKRVIEKKLSQIGYIPSVRITKGSTVEETLRREIEEETGVTEISDIKPVSMVLSNIRIPVEGGDFGLILTVCQCSIPEKADIKISEEHITYKWFSLKEAVRLPKVKYPNEFVNIVGGL